MEERRPTLARDILRSHDVVARRLSGIAMRQIGRAEACMADRNLHRDRSWRPARRRTRDRGKGVMEELSGARATGTEDAKERGAKRRQGMTTGPG